METIYTFKLPKSMVRKLKLISNFYDLNEKLWLKKNISNILLYEYNKVRDLVDDMYIKGLIQDRAYFEFSGFTPTPELRAKRKKISFIKEKSEMTYSNYLENYAHKMKIDVDSSYYDEYMKNLVSALNGVKKIGVMG